VVNLIFPEPVLFNGEGDYSLNSLKEIKVTESYLGLDQDVRECQHKEPLNNCTTRHNIEFILHKCGCLPLSIRVENKVNI